MKVLNYYALGKTIPDDAVYIGRGNATRGLPHSPFANPFKMNTEADRIGVVQNYRDWLWQQLQAGKILEADLLALQGKNLVCYCAPKACHGDVLKDAVAWAVRRAAVPLAKPSFQP